MNKRSRLRWFFVPLITFIFGMFGCVLSHWISEGIIDGQLAHWHSLGTPPGGGVRFVWFELDSQHAIYLYVETSSGKVYRRFHDGSDTWIETEPPEKQRFPNCHDNYDPVSHPAFTNLPGEVVDCYEIQWTFEWVLDNEILVILEDGSVWKWRNYWGMESMLFGTFGAPLAAIGIGWGIVALVKRARSKRTFNAYVPHSPEL